MQVGSLPGFALPFRFQPFDFGFGSGENGAGKVFQVLERARLVGLIADFVDLASYSMLTCDQ